MTARIDRDDFVAGGTKVTIAHADRFREPTGQNLLARPKVAMCVTALS
jgi:hypothetical protein